jgi:hypothetical protein
MRKWWTALCAIVLSLGLTGVAHAVPTGFSDSFEQRLLNWIFKQTALTLPTSLYYSLHGSDPGDTCTGELVSGTSPSYARSNTAPPDANSGATVNYHAFDTVSSATRASNKLAITFPTATGNWNSSAAINWWCLWDQVSAGNCLLCGTISGGGVIVLNGNTLSFAGSGSSPGQLTFTVD